MAAIQPNDVEGETPLLPILNRYKPIGTSAEVDFMTTRFCHGTERSQINQVVLDTDTWESSACFRLERSDVVDYYVRNDHLGLGIPYEYTDISHSYERDFVVRLKNDVRLILEIKGFETDQELAKYAGAERWVSAVSTTGMNLENGSSMYAATRSYWSASWPTSSAITNPASAGAINRVDSEGDRDSLTRRHYFSIDNYTRV